MPKPTKGPRLGGSPAHERLMLSNLACSLFENESLTTTEARAKRLQPLAEKLITKARRGDLHARRQVLSRLRNKAVVAKLFEEIAPAIDAQREGGYTRIIKMGNRRGDNAPLAEISLVLETVEKKKKVSAKKTEDVKKETSTGNDTTEETEKNPGGEAELSDEASDTKENPELDTQDTKETE